MKNWLGEQGGGAARDSMGRGTESLENKEGSDHHNALIRLQKGSWCC